MSLEVENHVIELLPDFVLELLTDEETKQVVKHLAECPICQVERSRLQSVADDLPLALVQTSPPPAVKDRLMGAIHSPQMKIRTPNQSPIWQRLESLLRGRLPALGLALIVVMALGNLLLFRQLNLANQRSTSTMRVIALANTKDSPQAVGTLVTDQKGIYGTLVVDNLARLDSSHQYQVWLTQDGKRISGGVFSVNPDGYASLEILAPLPLIQYDAIGITIEPSGGSPGPTGAKVLGGAILQ